MKRLLPALALLVGCATLLHPTRTASDDPIRVPHGKHMGAKVECITCHDTVWDSKKVHEPGLLPPEDKCMECHQEKKDAGECGMCHTNVKKAGPWVDQDDGIKLSHADHIPRVKEDCARCHVKLPDEHAEPVGSFKPSMDTCRSCHNHEVDYQQGRCELCHTDLKRKPLKPVASFSHNGNFVKDHALVARGDGASCATCHDQNFCADCHAKTAHPGIEVKLPERVDRDFIHRGDWIGRHSIEAAADPAMCQRCHGTSFCQDCHASNGLTPTAAGKHDPHPPGWGVPGAGQFHGDAARRDITSCAACHDQGPQTNCIACHREGGAGGDPHPVGWGSQHTREESRTERMCLYCHG